MGCLSDCRTARASPSLPPVFGIASVNFRSRSFPPLAEMPAQLRGCIASQDLPTQHRAGTHTQHTHTRARKRAQGADEPLWTRDSMTPFKLCPSVQNHATVVAIPTRCTDGPGSAVLGDHVSVATTHVFVANANARQLDVSRNSQASFSSVLLIC